MIKSRRHSDSFSGHLTTVAKHFHSRGDGIPKANGVTRIDVLGNHEPFCIGSLGEENHRCARTFPHRMGQFGQMLFTAVGHRIRKFDRNVLSFAPF
jgi:hypothetical protein